MKQRTKRFLKTAYLSLAVGVMTACNSGGSSDNPGIPGAPVNPTITAGTLTVAKGPTSVGGNFVAIEKSAKIVGNHLSVSWAEESVNHVETLYMAFNLANSQNVVNFSSTDYGSSSSSGIWICSDGSSSPTDACKGVTVDKNAGVVTFADQVLSGQVSAGQSSTASIITLNGTLHFTPPSGITPTPTPGPTPTPTPWTGTSTATGNNSAVLSGGAVIGKGTTAVNDLRKQIAVTVLGTNTSFTVGTAYATRSTALLDYADIIMPVTNIGTEALCFVQLTGIIYRDVSGTAIGVPSSHFVQGSVRKLSSGIFTDTCLAPGETGMAGTIQADLYAKVAKMEFTLQSSVSANSAPVTSVVPQSYTLLPPTSIYAGSFSIKALNVGAGPALVGEQSRFHMWFLFDDAGRPLSWGLTDSTTPSVIAANGTATITDDVFYDGSGGSKLQVFVDFEDTTLAASFRQTSGIALSASDICPASLPTNELMLCRNEIRNQRLERLKSSYDAQGSAP